VNSVAEVAMDVLSMVETEGIVDPIHSKINAILFKDTQISIVKILLMQRVPLLVEKNTDQEANALWVHSIPLEL